MGSPETCHVCGQPGYIVSGGEWICLARYQGTPCALRPATPPAPAAPATVDAGAMREACAKLCDEVAAEDAADEREADAAGDDQLSAMARESGRTATYLAETIRALPLSAPASATAVEEARKAVVEAAVNWTNNYDVDDDGPNIALSDAVLKYVEAERVEADRGGKGA